VLGKTHYFGNAKDDPTGEKALDLWLFQKDDLLAGQVPPQAPDALTGNARPSVVKSRKRRKSKKEFPLTLRKSDNRWCKKVLGKMHYFGNANDDPAGEKALDLWLSQKDYLLAGKVPPQAPGNALPGVVTTDEVVNRFLRHKLDQVEAGDRAQRTYDRYYAACAKLIDVLGRTRAAADLGPDDFRRLRAALAADLGPVALRNELVMVRSVFNFAVEEGLIEHAPRYGKGFEMPDAKRLRKARRAKGARMFTAEQIKAALEHATTNAKAMFLLGVNAGLGNTDVALLPIAAVDLKAGWLDYPRSKTEVERRVPLWPETLDAIRKVLEERCEPVDPADASLLFIGKRGESYIGHHRGYRVDQEIRRVLKKAKVEGRSFYDLRRTFQTIGDGSLDFVAVQKIMGHAPPEGDMSARYRQALAEVDDPRLQKVVDHVRAWLWPTA
jgi:integrase